MYSCGGDVKLTWDANNALVLELLGCCCCSLLSQKYGSRIVKRVQEMRQEWKFLLSSFQTLYDCADRANLSDIRSVSLLRSARFIPVNDKKFLIDSGFSYCRVVCEASMKLLLMIYWVGLKLLLVCHAIYDISIITAEMGFNREHGTLIPERCRRKIRSRKIVFNSPTRLIYHLLWFYLFGTRSEKKFSV